MRRWIQRFEVLATLGVGGMGTVYRARDPQLERHVAIKVINRPVAEAEAELSRDGTLDLRTTDATGGLLSEARMMARLSHPNVLPVYEVGLVDGEVFVVMELVVGTDARRWLAKRRSARAIREVFAQAARGLAAAHAHDIVHRDFKPENMLVADDGSVRVADFGLSELQSRRAATADAEPAGTPRYMAPELWASGRASAASDVFALCTAATEALAGVTDRRQAERALRERGVDRTLRGMLVRGLGDDPARRPTAAELVAVLARRPSRAWWLVPFPIAIAGGIAAAVATRSPPPCAGDELGVIATTSARFAPQFATEDAALGRTLAAVCVAERAGEVTGGEARQRVSCVERHAMLLAAVASQLDRIDLPTARERVERMPIADCETIAAPPLVGERGEVAALYQRVVEIDLSHAPPRTIVDQLARIADDAERRGEAELVVRADLWIGNHDLDLDDFAAADAAYARAYKAAVAIGANNAAIAALASRSLASVKLGDTAAATSYGHLAVELATPDVVLTTRLLAWAAGADADVQRGAPQAAIELLRRALTTIAADGHHHTVRELQLRWSLIQALQQLGGHDPEALALANENLGLAERGLGTADVNYGIALNVVGHAYRLTGDAKTALDYRRRALAVIAAALPATDSVVISQHAEVAADLYGIGKFEEARAEMAAAVTAADGVPAMRANRPMMLADLGNITFAAGRTGDGLRLFEQGLEDMIALKGQDHPDVLAYREGRVDLELEVGKVDDAELHAAALERSFAAAPDQALARARFEGTTRAQLALDRHRPGDAEALARGALASLAELHGDDAGNVAVRASLADALVDAGRPDEALHVLEEAAPMAQRAKVDPDELAELDLIRARALLGKHRTEEARRLAAAARATLEAYPGELRLRAVADAIVGTHARRR